MCRIIILTARIATALRVVTALLILTAFAVVPTGVAEEAAANPVTAADEIRIHPWRASLPPSLPAPGSLETPHSPPRGYFFDEARMAVLKRQALVRSDQPRGRIVPVDGADPDDGPAIAPTPSAPEIRTFFNGLNYMTSGYEGNRAIVPDTIVAASESRVLEATNYALRLTNRQGGRALVTTLRNLFAETGALHLFDPRVYFDRLSGRFFVVASGIDFNTEKSFVYLGVSRSSTPSSLAAPADWCTYRLGSGVVWSWNDYPALGVNERWVAISTNQFTYPDVAGEIRFGYVMLYGFNKQELVDNADGCGDVSLFRHVVTRDLTEQIWAFTLQPAQHYTESGLAGTPLFFFSSDPVSGPYYVLWRFEDTGNPKPRLSSTILTADDAATTPPNAPQRSGADLDTGGKRIMQVAFRDGRIWAVHTTGCRLGAGENESCVRALEITPTDADATLSYQETYGGGDGWFFWMPGIAINELGDVVVPFQRSRGDRNFGAAFNGKRASDSEFDAVRLLVRGKCPIESFDGYGRNRTGDYVGAQTDPAGNLAFWIAAEFPDRFASECRWKTRVARVLY